jgi:hypothetical protein
VPLCQRERSPSRSFSRTRGVMCNVEDISRFRAVLGHDPELSADSTIAHWRAAWLSGLAASRLQQGIPRPHQAVSKQHLHRWVEQVFLKGVNNSAFHFSSSALYSPVSYISPAISAPCPSRMPSRPLRKTPELLKKPRTAFPARLPSLCGNWSTHWRSLGQLGRNANNTVPNIKASGISEAFAFRVKSGTMPKPGKNRKREKPRGAQDTSCFLFLK